MRKTAGQIVVSAPSLQSLIEGIRKYFYMRPDEPVHLEQDKNVFWVNACQVGKRWQFRMTPEGYPSRKTNREVEK